MTEPARARKGPPTLEAAIPEDGVIPILKEVEALRTTGQLWFEGAGVTGMLPLRSGELGSAEPRPDGRDPVDVLLELREGKVRVYQLLPPLPVSKGDDRARHGSLSVHAPADLMNYCERAGLTGTLSLEQGARQAVAIYDRGDLSGIRLDGDDEADLREVFGWDEGSFRITVRGGGSTADGEPAAETEEPTAEAPAAGAPAHPRTDTGQRFLRVMEVELSRILPDREAERPARVGPAVPELPRPRARHPTLPGLAPRPKPRPTVKVVYLGSGPAEVAPHAGVRHVRTGGSEEALPAASPDRVKTVRLPRPPPSSGVDPSLRAEEVKPAGAKKPSGEVEPELSVLGRALAWAAVVFLCGLLILAFLARLPGLN